KNIQAICIELPGHGLSKLPNKDLTLNNMSQMIHETIKSLINESPYSIVGHSLGGYVALHIAKMENNQISQMILLHSHPWADSPSKQKDRMRLAKVVEYNKSLFLKEAIPHLFHYPKEHQPRIHQLI